MVKFLSENVYERIFDNSYQCLKSMIALAEKCEDAGNKVYSVNFSLKNYGIGECYNKIASFCQQYYENEHLEHRDTLETQKNIIVSVLRGMRYSSKEARLQFPRILQLQYLENFDLVETFVQEVSNFGVQVPHIF